MVCARRSGAVSAPVSTMNEQSGVSIGSLYPDGQVNGTAEDCRSPLTRQLVDYWRARLPAAGGLPRWRDFVLMDLYAIAAFVSVKDVVDGGADFRNRFWGSGLTEGLGFEGTNRLVSGYEPEAMRLAVMNRYAGIVATGQSSMARGHFVTLPARAHLTYELVHLPLWGADDRVGHIISAYHFGFKAEDARG